MLKKRNKPDKFANLFSDVSAKALGNNAINKKSSDVVTWMSTPYNHPQQASSYLLVQQVPSMGSTAASKRDGLVAALCRNSRPDYIPVRLVGRQLDKGHPFYSSNKRHPPCTHLY